jgi:hypothetical protein
MILGIDNDYQFSRAARRRLAVNAA